MAAAKMEVAEQRLKIPKTYRHSRRYASSKATPIASERCRKCRTLLKGRFNMCGSDIREFRYCDHDKTGFVIASHGAGKLYTYWLSNARSLSKYTAHTEKFNVSRYEIQPSTGQLVRKVQFKSFSTGVLPSARLVLAKLYRFYEEARTRKLAEKKFAARQKTRSKGKVRGAGGSK